MKIKISNIIMVMLIAALVLTAFNSYQISKIRSDSGGVLSITGFASKSNSIIPTGVPKSYGKELGVSFDDISPNDPYKADQTISKLKQLDKDIELSGANLDRYIDVLYNLNNGISCEYCCGARAVIFSDGSPACGCAHSYAMRGLTKYLITKHGNEYTDEELLEEAGKWKTLFFPTQIQAKADILKEQGVELNYINLASNKYRGIEKGSGSGGMVGGC